MIPFKNFHKMTKLEVIIYYYFTENVKINEINILINTIKIKFTYSFFLYCL